MLVFFLAILSYLFLSISPTFATTLTSSVATGADDSRVSNATFVATNTTDTLGTDMNNPASFFFRFTNIDIPAGATISSAYLSFIGTGSNNGDVIVDISAQDVVNAVAPTNLTEFATYSTQLSDASVTWSDIPSPSWGIGISTPDLSSIVSEIIALPAWESGNAIQLYLTSNGSSSWSMRSVIMGDWSGGEAKPTLTINYSYAEFAPNSPSSLAQYQSDGSTPISSGASTSQTTVVLQFSLSSDNTSDSITPQVEIQPAGTDFTGTPNYSGDTVDYSGTPVTGTVTVTGLSRNQSYHWQARATNSAGNSSFVAKGSATDFSVTPVAPITTDNVDDSWHTSPVQITLTCTDEGGPGCATTYYTTDGSTPDLNSSSGNIIDFYIDGIYTLKYFSVDTNAVAEAVKTATNTVNIDTTSPSGTTISYNDGFYITSSVSLTAVDGTDSLSGIDTDSRIIQRRSATATDQICSDFSTWSTITPTGTYPNFTDSTVEFSHCYQYRYLVSDQAGNSATYTSSHTAQIESADNLLIQDLSVSLSSGTDDSRLVNGVFSNSSITDQLGKNDNNSANHLMLFKNVQIARNANLTSANLQLTLTGSGAGQVDINISAVNSDNPSAPSTASQFSAFESQLTSQSVGWTSVPVNLDYGTTVFSPDLTPVIQAIINRSDWTIGDSLLLWLGDNDSGAWSNSTFITADYQGSEAKPTLNISYIYSNSAPNLQDDSYLASSVITLGVLQNDSDPDGDTLTLSTVSSPAHGTAQISDSSIIYSPDPDYSGTDSFTYTVADGHSHTASATVTVTVSSNPVYYTYSFSADRSAVPTLYYNDLTYNLYLGTVDSVTATIDGSSVDGTYDPSTGYFYFTDTSQGSDLVITIKNPSDTSVFSPDLSALKDNKSFAWSHGMDDNVYLSAQVAILEAKGWRGMLYLIGKDIHETRNEAWIFDKPALIDLLNNGWSLGNHTWDHTCFGDEMSDDEFLSGTILNGYNRLAGIVAGSNRPTYQIIGFASPCFAIQYDPFVSAMRTDGTTAIKFNESQGNALMHIDSNAGGYSDDGKTAIAVNSDTLKIGRDLGIETDPDDSIAYLDWMATNSSVSRHFWYNTLSHGNKEESLSTVVNHAYSNYGPSGTNQLWMAPSDQIYSYFLTRDNTVLSTPVLTQVADGSSATTSGVESSPNTTSAGIAWSTDRDTTTQLLYGLTSSLGFQTDQTDTLVQSHTVSLSGLIPCTKYYYQTKSTGSYQAVSYGTQSSFITSGCLNSSSVSTSSEQSFSTATGGTLTLSTSDGNLSLAVPSAFAESDAVFQAKQLSKDTIISLTSLPAGYSSASNLFVDLTALTDPGTTLPDFNSSLSLTISYDPDNLSGLDLSTLTIFGYHSGSWQALSSCQIDTSAHTVTCTTDHFSVFSLFASQATTTSTPTPTPVITNSDDSPSNSSPSSTSYFCSDSAPGVKAPWLFGAVAQDSTSILLYFTQADDPVDHYVLEFGHSPDQLQFGSQDIGPQGTSTYLVQSLSPSTTYYFRVRAGHGCAVGSWSNLISAGTLASRFSPRSSITSSIITVPTPEPNPNCQTYTVISGDTLWSLASKFLGNGALYQQIIDDNSLSDESLSVGQKLQINCRPLEPTPPTEPTDPQTLSPSATLRLTITNNQGQPVKNATVTLHSDPQTAKTDINGQVEFTNVTPGQHQLIVDSATYQGQQSIYIPADTPVLDMQINLKPISLFRQPLVIGLCLVCIILSLSVFYLLFKKKSNL